ncbi:MAG: response regulator [Candidatus Omnitrophota bacterium]
MKKILIADDSLFMRTNLRDMLAGRFEIVEAASGEEVLAKFKDEKPDLVLLDIIMPQAGIEGIDILKNIMKIDPKAKVIVVSSMRQDFLIEKCRELGVTSYIKKPVVVAEMVELIEKTI